jgi:hypothetical protein
MPRSPRDVLDLGKPTGPRIIQSLFSFTSLGAIKMLNPPELIIGNIQSMPSRMQKVDVVLGEERLRAFAVALSRLLQHAETRDGSLSGCCMDSTTSAEVAFEIIEAAAELEIGWNVIRMANVPASQRQGRVAFELIGIAVLLALPVRKLRELPASRNPLLRRLQREPNTNVRTHCNYRLIVRDGRPVSLPPMKATDLFESFLDIMERLLGVNTNWIEGVKQYRREVQHPASHGSADLFQYHFQDTTRDMRAGNVLSEARIPTLQAGADDFIRLVENLVNLLDNVARSLAPRSAS